MFRYKKDAWSLLAHTIKVKGHCRKQRGGLTFNIVAAEFPRTSYNASCFTIMVVEGVWGKRKSLVTRSSILKQCFILVNFFRTLRSHPPDDLCYFFIFFFISFWHEALFFRNYHFANTQSGEETLRGFSLYYLFTSSLVSSCKVFLRRLIVEVTKIIQRLGIIIRTNKGQEFNN